MRVTVSSWCRAALLALAFNLAAHAQPSPWAESYRLEALGRYAEAQAPLEPLATRQPAHEFALLRTAWLLHLQGRFAESEKRYFAAAAMNTRAIEPWLGVMLPQMAHYRWADAMQAGRKALEINPWDYTAQVRLLMCEEALSRWADVAARAAALAQRFPSDATALVYAARAASALRDTRGAREHYAQVLERFPEHAEARKYLADNP
jgi:tetratricopeptide (TPR) repeat protein